MNDRPLFRKYARDELERRFLLSALPEGASAFEKLDDLYVQNTHVRLRRVTRPDGTWLATKLGQKLDGPDPRVRSMTTIYLPDTEGEVFAALPGFRTTKRRYKLVEQGHTFCIDVWERPLPGVMLAEVEAESLETLAALRVPDWVDREVTGDPSFSAIALAQR